MTSGDSNDNNDHNDHNDHEEGSKPCLFCSISTNRDFTSLLHVDQSVVALNDIKPAATHHILVIPKKHIPNVNCLKKDDLETVKKMKEIGLQLISCRLNKSIDELNDQKDKKEKIYQIGFVSPPFNSVNHIHMHVLSKPITTWWPKSLGFGKLIFKDVDDVIAKMEESYH